MSIWFIVIVIFTCLIIGFTKGGLSGVSLVVVPLLSLQMPPKIAVATSLPLLLVGDAFAVWAYWGKWDNQIIRLTLPIGIVGAVLGAYLLVQIPEQALRQIIGVLTLLYVAYRFVAYRLQSIEYDPTPPVAYAAGITAGIASSLANAGAPPIAAYLLLKRTTPTIFVAVFALYFAVINVVKLPLFVQADLLSWDAFVSVIWAAPFIPLGVWLGRIFVRWVEPRVFNIAVLVVLFVTGVALLIPTPPAV